ncbi:hypothetical protein MACK_002147 [Theileria orientalis]|uniref:Uncharacterized protein n=1 Tax=Theileria orientalis TaxID=68886 RepID=A0A976MB71_THEOR|nr:hypothetical protein MACK_002147 [Theileria orientalis]
MSKPGYKDLGISSKEYEEALLLERLFKLVKKNPCSTCLLKKPTHVDLDRFDLVCTNCSKRCSSKIQIGKGVISMADLERLESIYDKSKKKQDRPKKQSHVARSPSVSSVHSHNYKKYNKYTHSDSGSEVNQRSRSKRRSKKRESFRHQPHQDHYPEVYDKYPVRSNPLEGYPRPYPDERYTPQFRPHRERSRRDVNVNRPRDMPRDMPLPRESYMNREPPVGVDKHKTREYDTRREHDMGRDAYPQHPSYGYYGQHRLSERYVEGYQPTYHHAIKRNQTVYDYPTQRRDVPGMMGLMSNHGYPNGMVVRNQLALPPPDKGYTREKNSHSLALTNGFQAFRSLPPPKTESSASNNPFSKRTIEQAPKPYDFSHMREALNPPKTLSRYQESYYPRDFNLSKLGNPGFPDSSANYYNRY